jgi:hypothetical protein
MAAGILDQTRLARQEIGVQNAPGAVDHIRQAITLAKSIQEQTAGQTKPVLIPVAWEVETTSTYAPVKGGKSGEISADRMKKGTSVREVQAEITSAKLDVASAADRLETARIALERQDWGAADNALSAISKSLIRTRTDEDMPLLKVRQNLQLAKARVLEEKYKDAAAPLRAAAEGLAQFEQMFPGPRADTAETMRQDIETYARNIAREHARAADQIDGWLQPVEQWYAALTKK